MLKTVSSKTRNGCIVNVLKGRNHCRESPSFGLGPSQVEETTIKTILISNTIRWLELTVKDNSYAN